MHVHPEIRDLSLKIMGYAPSAVIGSHPIPRRAKRFNSVPIWAGRTISHDLDHAFKASFLIVLNIDISDTPMK